MTARYKIIGPTEFAIEIDGGNQTRVMLVSVAEEDGFPDETLIWMERISVLNGKVFNSGAGIVNYEDLVFSGGTVQGNRASDDGGGIYSYGTLTVVNSTLTGNSAGDRGGAMYIPVNYGYGTLISNSTISGNEAGTRGGGIFNIDPYTWIEYSTITQNQAGALTGGGILNGSGGAITITGSIVSDNFYDRDLNSLGGTFTSGGYNFIGGYTSAYFTPDATDLIGTDPMLSPLEVTGGQVATHQPLEGSPVIDAGNDAPANAPLSDQRGEPFQRIYDGDLDGTARIDIGAYELQAVTFMVDYFWNNIDDGDYSVGNLTLREAIKLANESPFADTVTWVGSGWLNPAEPMVITDSLTIQAPSGGFRFTDNVEDNFDEDRLFVIDDGDALNEITVTFDGSAGQFDFQFFSGGVFESYEDLFLENVFFSDNSTELVSNITPGGAIYQSGGSLTIAGDSVITGNSTLADQSKGGGIYATGADVTLSGLVVSGNTTAGLQLRRGRHRRCRRHPHHQRRDDLRQLHPGVDRQRGGAVPLQHHRRAGRRHDHHRQLLDRHERRRGWPVRQGQRRRDPGLHYRLQLDLGHQLVRGRPAGRWRQRQHQQLTDPLQRDDRRGFHRGAACPPRAPA